MNHIFTLGYRIFGKGIKEDPLFSIKLKQAHINIPYNIYISGVYLISTVFSIIGIIIGFLVSKKIIENVNFNIHIPYYKSLEIFYQNKEILSIVLTIFLFSMAFMIIIYNLMIFYPSFRANSRKTKIDLSIPHSLAFMHAMSKGGLNILDIFKEITKFRNIYGECGEEIAYIILDIEYHGLDVLSAIKKAIETTPSEKFAEFCEGLITVLDSGGDITEYFGNKIVKYRSIAFDEQRSYIHSLEVIAESYITIMVAGPVFLITILIMLGIIDPKSIDILHNLIYIFIPLFALIFIIFIEAISVSEPSIKKPIEKSLEELNKYKDVRIECNDYNREIEKIKRLKKKLTIARIVKQIKNPLEQFYINPFYSLYLSGFIIVGLFILLYQKINQMQIEEIYEFIIDSMVFLIFIFLIPFTFFYEKRSRKIDKIQNEIPNFVKKIVNYNDAGLSLTASMELIAETSKKNVLEPDLKIIRRDTRWGKSISEALIKFENRLQTPSISRVINLITKASEASNKMRDVLLIASKDAYLSQKLKDERYSSMISFVMIIYITFGVYLFIISIICTSFLPLMSSDSISYGEIPVESLQFTWLNIVEMKKLLYHSVLIQAFFSGLIAGQMGSSTVLKGLKHSIIMMVISVGIFTLFI